MKKIFAFFSLFILPSIAFGAGFVPDSIWLSSNDPVDGDVVDIYVTIFNGEDSNLSGNVRYYDEDLLLGEVPVVVPPKSSKLVTLAWEADQGDRILFAQFTPNSGALEETKKIRIRIKKLIIPEPSQQSQDGEEPQEDSGQVTSLKEIASTAGEVTTRIAGSGFEYAEEGRGTTLGALESAKSNLKDKKETLLLGGVAEVDSQFKYDIRKAYLSILIWLLSALVVISASKIFFYIAILVIVYFIIRLIRKRRAAYEE